MTKDYVFPRNFRRTSAFHWVGLDANGEIDWDHPGCLLQDHDEVFHNGFHDPDPCPKCGKIRWHGEKGECSRCINGQPPRMSMSELLGERYEKN